MKSNREKRRKNKQYRQREAKNKKGAVLKDARQFDDSLRLKNADDFIWSLLNEILAHKKESKDKASNKLDEKFDGLNAVLANLFSNRTVYTYLSMSSKQYGKPFLRFQFAPQFVPDCIHLLRETKKIKFEPAVKNIWETRIRITPELNSQLKNIQGIRPTKIYPKELVELKSRVQYKLDENGKRVKKKSGNSFKYVKEGGELIDYKKMKLPYTTKKEINGIRTDLHKLNDLNASADIQLFIENKAMVDELKTFYEERYNFVDSSQFKPKGCIPLDTRIKAVFTDNFDYHGRLYATGMFRYQGIRKRYRPLIFINGEPTIEYDFSSLHPALLYANVGQELEIKPYQFNFLKDFENRILKPLLKTMFLSMINAKSKGYVTRAMNSWLFYGFKDNWNFCPANYGSLSGSEKDLYESVEVVKKYFGFDAVLRKFVPGKEKVKWSDIIHSIRNKFLELHGPINKFLDSKNDDTGMRLMKQDSDICLDVCKYFIREQVPVLPLHDSFLIQEKYGNELKEVMMDTYKDHTKKDNITIHENKPKKQKKDYSVIDGKIHLNPEIRQTLMGYASI